MVFIFLELFQLFAVLAVIRIISASHNSLVIKVGLSFLIFLAILLPQVLVVVVLLVDWMPQVLVAVAEFAFWLEQVVWFCNVWSALSVSGFVSKVPVLRYWWCVGERISICVV